MSIFIAARSPSDNDIISALLDTQPLLTPNGTIFQITNRWFADSSFNPNLPVTLNYNTFESGDVDVTGDFALRFNSVLLPSSIQQLDFLTRREDDLHTAFDLINGYINDLHFVETNNAAATDLLILTTPQSSFSQPNIPGANNTPIADLSVTNSQAYIALSFDAHTETAEIGAGSASDHVYIHEIAHSFDLEEGGARLKVEFPNLDNSKYTVMSREYRDVDVYAENIDTITEQVAHFSSLNDSSYGRPVGLMALDIAAIQSLYGQNSNNVTDTVYNLTDGAQVLGGLVAPLDVEGADGSVSIGRAYFSIWDANVDLIGPIDPNNTSIFGGADTLSYEGSLQSAWINLNDATIDVNYNTTDVFASDYSHDIQYLFLRDSIVNSDLWGNLGETFRNEIDATVDAAGNPITGDIGSYHAGGFFSQLFTWSEDSAGNNIGVSSIQDGGYSIANGVIIENASGGENDDVLIGNEYANGLMGNGGDDFIFGGAGNDQIYGGAGDDTINGGQGDDILTGGDMPIADGSGGFFDFFVHTVFGNSKESKDQVDTFVFNEGFGNDTITDFYAQSSSHDIISLNLGTDFDTFAEVMAVAQKVGNDVFFDFGNGDTLTLLDVKMNHLDAGDFDFFA